MSNNQPTARAEFGVVKTFLPYLWPRGEFELKARVVIALLLLFAAKVANVYVPVLYKYAVDALGGGAKTGATGGGADTTTLIVVPVGLIVAYGLIRVLSSAFGELRDAVFAKVAQRAIRTSALGVFEHLHALSLRFHLDRQMGGLTRAIERGVKGIEFLLSFMLFNILPTFLEIFMVSGILWVLYDFWFALITFVTIVIYIAFTLIVTEWRMKFRREMNQRDDEANTKAIDSLINYETVKYFNNEEHESRRYDHALRGYEVAAVKSQESLSKLNIGQGAIIAVGLVLNMLLAANGVKDGSMTIGDFVLVNTYLLQLYMPLNFLGFVYRQIKQSLTDMERMFSLLDVEKEVEDKKDAPDLVCDQASIRFEDVKFSYNPDRQILKGVSFDVPAGKTVAVVGPSGAGKSTLTRLMFRFYDVSSGRITIDGQDIRDVSQTSLRRSIGIVPQDTVLFNDTIAYNIAYGRPGASDAEITNAAKLASIDRFIAALPEGSKAMVGERGLKLSGGEKQRVSIARMLLKRPKVMIFDEATSALDTRTEKDIQQALRDVSRGHTTLMIAHRLSTVIDADEIIVLREGQVAERGRHQDLLTQDGLYAEMWAQQQEIREAEEILAHAGEVTT
ncbi:ABCB family ABC transporter ATP-binding protein/permease [Thalassospira alkalitolerans]|uniref:Metal ABC transporter permease n=1 Tax=Thalassospira alkalitolerans TaxID=1293890 RepID=A0A1Y2L9G8_9PROT|nr:ABC transporter ATP-binding protein/permease [Thalassospira alkalitolerans]OSQ47100.1 metal ABC transporter permease [Thalassospira alkalitolerans]|tara:strand:- start:47514 stop:49370 length:1857 start_codon:yes stop_codon:yes gene_type:complete